MTGFSEYRDYDAVGLAGLIRARDVSAEEALEAAIARVEAVNPKLNAVVHRMDDEGRRVLAAGLPDGPFAGVPFMLKDLYALYKGAPTSNGSRLWADYVADHDFTYVERCRAAGLVVFGKTNTPELGINATTEPQLHGPTRNPWNLEHSAGGSSGGAAAAVAAGMLPMAHATDGGGSIRIPAANCGLFGLKPTRARNPAGPDVGEGWSGMSTGHVVSRSVRDSAVALDCTAGPAPGDPYWAPPPARAYAEEVGADPGQLRIAMLTTAYDGSAIDPECVAAVEAAAKLCESLGHGVEPLRAEVDTAAITRAMRVIIAGNLWNALALRAGALGREPSGQDVEPATWSLAQEGRRLSAADYAAAVTALHQAGRRMAALFEDCDVILSTTLRRPPLPLGTLDQTISDADRYYDRLNEEIPFTPLYNATGCPAMSVPLHWSADGLPVGVHFGAAFGREDLLFRLAGQLEQAQPWFGRLPPL